MRGEGARGEDATNEGDITFLLAVRGSEERRTTAHGLQKVLFKARPVELLFTFCPNLSNCQSECEVCCIVMLT